VEEHLCIGTAEKGGGTVMPYLCNNCNHSFYSFAFLRFDSRCPCCMSTDVRVVKESEIPQI